MRIFVLALLVGVIIHIIPCPAIAQGNNLGQILTLTESILNGLKTGAQTGAALPGSHTDRRINQGAYWIPTGNPWHGINPADIADHWRRVNKANGKPVYFVPIVAYNRWRTDKLNERVRLRSLGFKIPVPQEGDIVMTVDEVNYSRQWWERRSGIPSDLMPSPVLIENQKHYPWRDLLRGAGWQGVMPRMGK